MKGIATQSPPSASAAGPRILRFRRMGFSTKWYESHVGTSEAHAATRSTHGGAAGKAIRVKTMKGQCHRYQP